MKLERCICKYHVGINNRTIILISTLAHQRQQIDHLEKLIMCVTNIN